MNRHVEISASIMCINWLNAGEQLRVLESQGIDALHWDIIDGQFAADFTMGTSIINRFREVVNIKSEYHLMVEEPSALFQTLQFSPEDVIVIHQECCRNLHRDLVSIRRAGCRAGVAICPGTPLETLEYVIEDVDFILLLTVNPGFAGQRMIPQIFRKIEKCRQMIDRLGLSITLQIDGNVSPKNICKMVECGGDSLVGGSSGLFRKDISLESAIDIMRMEINKGLGTLIPDMKASLTGADQVT